MDDPVQPAQPARPRGAHDLRVDQSKHPGWTTAVERLPAAGEHVQTFEGKATVIRILGRTSSGGRLLELRMLDGRTAPFFAAAANVMVQPLGGSEDHGDGADPGA